MTYGGKSTVRDRSSGISSSVAFTPLQVQTQSFSLIECLLRRCWFMFSQHCFAAVIVLRGWRLWTHRLQRRRWLKPTRNISPIWQSSWKSRRSQRCENSHTNTHTHTQTVIRHVDSCTQHHNVLVKFVWHCALSCILVIKFWFSHFNKMR